MFAFNIELQVHGNGGGTGGLSTRTVGFGANEINGNRQLYLPDQVSQEQESAGGHAHYHRRRRNRDKIIGDFGCKLRDSCRDLELGP